MIRAFPFYASPKGRTTVAVLVRNSIFGANPSWPLVFHKFSSGRKLYSAEALSSKSLKDERLDSLSDDLENKPLLPREVVAELNRYIVGQEEAKRAVAVALRNRWRRRQLQSFLKDEVIPKNILMIGPTGVGKTEIARRLAKLAQSPFIKVEATKFTEVGFHGRDVDHIIRDLVDLAIQQTKQRQRELNEEKAKEAAEKRLIDLLVGTQADEATRKRFSKMLREGNLEDTKVELDMPVRPQRMDVGQLDLGQNFQIIPPTFIQMFKEPKKKTMSVAMCRPYLEEQEMEKLLNQELCIKEAIASVEQNGIVFIDEIDKICVRKESYYSGSADASSEGVQRDLLPLIEGCTINTKYGNVDTSKILFIASGAFHSCKPSDLLAELQGRLPIRVQLKGLNEQDLYNILTEPENNLLRQQEELMKTEDIDLVFEDEAIREIARVGSEVNTSVENIGARRLHTIIEKIVEDVSFNCDQYSGQRVTIDKDTVKRSVSSLLHTTDLSRFVL